MAYNSYFNPLDRALTPAVKLLLIATASISLLQWALESTAGNLFTLLFSLSVPGLEHGYVWQLVTYMFLHGGFWHLFLNLLGLFVFGPDTERVMGTRRFLVLYAACGIMGGLGWAGLTGSRGGICLGASGAIFGILGAFAALFPDRPMTLLLFFIMPVTMKARTMAIGLGLFNLLSMMGPGNVAYAAHVTGGLVGYLYAALFYRHGFPTTPRWNPRQWVNDLRWRWYRRKFKVLSAVDRDDPDRAPKPDEIDAILDKVSKSGIGSLNQRERDILNKASRP
jgi:membrane associated rhomboid family serine protease